MPVHCLFVIFSLQKIHPAKAVNITHPPVFNGYSIVAGTLTAPTNIKSDARPPITPAITETHKTGFKGSLSFTVAFLLITSGVFIANIKDKIKGEKC